MLPKAASKDLLMDLWMVQAKESWTEKYLVEMLVTNLAKEMVTPKVLYLVHWMANR